MLPGKKQMITKIDNYSLNQPIEEAPDLEEFTPEEYLNFEMAGMKLMFKDEKIYHGNNVCFADPIRKVWDTVIGATEGKIYKISIQHMVQDKNESNAWFRLTLGYLGIKMGKYNEHPFLSKVYIWDSPEGNVILNQVSKFGHYSINLFLTSSSIRKQYAEHR